MSPSACGCIEQCVNCFLTGDSPVTARDLLRSGPFSGLRDNIRAIGEYAAAAATGAAGGSGSSSSSSSSTDAGALVLGFFKELEGLDRLLYEAVRRVLCFM